MVYFKRRLTSYDPIRSIDIAGLYEKSWFLLKWIQRKSIQRQEKNISYLNTQSFHSPMQSSHKWVWAPRRESVRAEVASWFNGSTIQSSGEALTTCISTLGPGTATLILAQCRGEALESEPAPHSPHSSSSYPTGLGPAPHSRSCHLVHKVTAPLRLGHHDRGAVRPNFSEGHCATQVWHPWFHDFCCWNWTYEPKLKPSLQLGDP